MSANANLKTWMHHLHDETDAAFLYRVLAEKCGHEGEKKKYLHLADIEDKHRYAWVDLLQRSGYDYSNVAPSAQARLTAAITKWFGTGFLRELMLREESREVNSYLKLYRSSKDVSTRIIALQLAEDSARHANTLTEISERGEEPWHRTGSGGMLRNIVYGFNDGLTANFGLIAGVIGADVAPHFILLSGIAGTVADSLSMGSSGFLAAKSQREVYEKEKRMEADEIKCMPQLEKEEFVAIYMGKGMSEEKAKEMAEQIMKNPEQALEEKVKEELGIGAETISPLREGWVTGLSTAVGAIIPVIPFFFIKGLPAIIASFLISMLTHFAVGAARSVFTGRNLWRSGFDMFVVGMGIAVVGYFVGDWIVKLL